MGLSGKKFASMNIFEFLRIMQYDRWYNEGSQLCRFGKNRGRSQHNAVVRFNGSSKRCAIVDKSVHNDWNYVEIIIQKSWHSYDLRLRLSEVWSRKKKRGTFLWKNGDWIHIRSVQDIAQKKAFVVNKTNNRDQRNLEVTAKVSSLGSFAIKKTS